MYPQQATSARASRPREPLAVKAESIPVRDAPPEGERTASEVGKFEPNLKKAKIHPGDRGRYRRPLRRYLWSPIDTRYRRSRPEYFGCCNCSRPRDRHCGTFPRSPLRQDLQPHPVHQRCLPPPSTPSYQSLSQLSSTAPEIHTPPHPTYQAGPRLATTPQSETWLGGSEPGLSPRLSITVVGIFPLSRATARCRRSTPEQST